ncbi:MAG: inosine/xanthosine triphosphatase [Candidatus ainarchaeum sp.]|nr:inosine/xanthosine triphosphatase [Candidatus ainarchaeum sp.]
MYGRVAVAGTFDALHCGHADLFDAAFRLGRRVVVGVTSDGFARRLRSGKVKPYAERVSAVRRFLGKARLARAEFLRLCDPYGPALGNGAGIEALVVSTETFPRAREINEIRRKRGLAPLAVEVVPLVYAEDLKKIASRRVSAGKTDARGSLLKPVTVAVGSRNPSKLEGVRLACRRIFPESRVVGVAADSRVSVQPFGNETIHGAVNRAIAARRKSGADYGAGLESGLFELYGRHFDFQWCAVFDGENVTLGCSMGFEVPSGAVRLIRRGKMDLGEAFGELTGIREIGRFGGALGYLSRGIAERREMSEQAFVCAMVPRLNRLNYGKTRVGRKGLRRPVPGKAFK